MQMGKSKSSIKLSPEVIGNGISHNAPFRMKKTVNSTSNLQANVPKSTDNIISHRLNYKKTGAFNNEPESAQHIPQILANQNNFMKPRVLKTTTPYKTEKKEIIKKLSEKDMHFEDINSFKVIYKFEEEEKNKLPTINNKQSSNQSSFNNTFNPFEQSIKTKMNFDQNFNDTKIFKNPSSQKIPVQNDPKIIVSKAFCNVNKVNLINEYFVNKQVDNKSNQLNKTGKLEPIQLKDASSKKKGGEIKIVLEKEGNSLQKAKFPKEIFCSNIPKKYIV